MISRKYKGRTIRYRKNRDGLYVFYLWDTTGLTCLYISDDDYPSKELASDAAKKSIDEENE